MHISVISIFYGACWRACVLHARLGAFNLNALQLSLQLKDHCYLARTNLRETLHFFCDILLGMECLSIKLIVCFL